PYLSRLSAASAVSTVPRNWRTWSSANLPSNVTSSRRAQPTFHPAAMGAAESTPARPTPARAAGLSLGRRPTLATATLRRGRRADAPPLATAFLIQGTCQATAALGTAGKPRRCAGGAGRPATDRQRLG